MFESIIGVLLAHKQFVIAIRVHSSIREIFLYSIRYFNLSIPGVDIDLSDGVMVDVTNGRYIHIDMSDGNVVVDVNGIHIDTGSLVASCLRNHIQPFNYNRLEARDLLRS